MKIVVLCHSLPRWWMLSILSLALLLGGCGGNTQESSALGPVAWSEDSTIATGPAIGQRAPNFRLETVTGDTLMLAEQLGQPVLINFFATWCASCREEMAVLQAASGRQWTVLGVDLRESAETVAALAQETGTTFPLALDRQGTVTREYRVTNLPATYILDGEGVVRQIVRGPIDEETIEQALQAIVTPATSRGA